MPNQQSYFEWLWNNDPWMFAVLIISWIAMFSCGHWARRRFVKAPVYPSPRVMYIIPPIGALIAALLGWYYHPANGYLIFEAAFGGLVLGYFISMIVHLPKAALRGAMVGLVLTVLFMPVEIWMAIKNGQNPWLNQAWADRLGMGCLIVFASVFFSCELKMRSLAAEHQSSDPPASLHPSG